MFWKLDDFKEWASHVLDVVRELRTTFQQPGDLVWRADAAGKLIAARIDVNSIKAMLYSQRSMDLLLSME